MPLANAVFGLLSGERVAASAVSNTAGEIFFDQIPPGSYRLAELRPSEGYTPNGEEAAVQVVPDGAVTINGQSVDGPFLLRSHKKQEP